MWVRRTARGCSPPSASIRVSIELVGPGSISTPSLSQQPITRPRPRGLTSVSVNLRAAEPVGLGAPVLLDVDDRVSRAAPEEPLKSSQHRVAPLGLRYGAELARIPSFEKTDQAGAAIARRVVEDDLRRARKADGLPRK